MRIEDVSPRDDNTTLVFNRDFQSVSGKGLCCAISANGTRAYLGGHSGVWRSDDGGLTWSHPEQPQPRPGATLVPGALLAPNVYDLLISPVSADIVLAVTGRDARRPSAGGIYRSTDGARSWMRVHAYRVRPHLPPTDATGCLAIAPDDPALVFAMLCPDAPGLPASAGDRSYSVARSADGGATWAELPPPPFLGGRWHIAAGPREGGFRRVYAVGNGAGMGDMGVSCSVDGGQTWATDPMQFLSIGPPTDGVGASSRAVGIHPRNPAILYVLMGDGVALWRGQFPPLPATGPAIWTKLWTPPKTYSGTTPSGGGFVVPHVTTEGQLYLIVSDRRTTHVCAGEPTAEGDWHRIEDLNCHLDPHGFAATPDFHPQLPYAQRPRVPGRALLVNDGGVNVTVDGGRSWRNGRGLSTLGIVNVAVNVARGKPAALCIGMPDNSGFSSRNGAASWKVQHYVGGDNDCCFADPLHPQRLVVFSPRYGPDGARKGCLIYTGSGGNTPNAGFGTSQFREMEGPPFLDGTNLLRARGHNLVSNFYNGGYRPLVFTLAGEAPRPDGDLVLIRYTADQALLLRTLRMSEISERNHWVTGATSETEPAFTFQQGPPLPNPNIGSVQASGGHADPTFYVGDQAVDMTGTAPRALFRLWKWKRGMPAWRQLVPRTPAGPAPGPLIARRYFADPYRPALIYVLADDGVWRSDNGGDAWTLDAPLGQAISEGGAFPMNLGAAGSTDSTPDPVLLRDMLFDPSRPGCRFALGPAGVFHTVDGRHWSALLRAPALASHINNAAYDPVSCERALYVATYGRGLLRLAPIPPDWDFPIGSLQTAIGRIGLLRVHDAGSGFGPPHDLLDAEVIVLLDSEPEKSFGFKLRPGADARNAKAMLGVLRDAFRRDAVIHLEFFRSGCRTGTIHRIIETQ